MRMMTRWLGAAVALGLLLGLWPRLGAAQLAPTGGHYAGRASDTGSEPGAVNASGGYAASVPLDLPAARGGLPVPLSIGFGARGVGAVGLGWDIPLAYVRRDTSFFRRRPQFGSDSAPVGRTQVTLSIQGQMMDLVPKGSTWVVRYDSPELSLREQGGGWVMYDGQGRTWTFLPQGPTDVGLYLLDSITGPGGTSVKLEYTPTLPTVPGGGSAFSLDLTRVLYNKHPTAGCYKNEVLLTYGAVQTEPLSLFLMGDFVFARMRTLSMLDVKARADCATAPVRLRRYDFTYLPDADTRQPRLSAVRMSGREGTPEQSVSLPVSAYTYGSATTAGKLQYARTQTVSKPTGAATPMSSTSQDTTVSLPVSGVPSVTWQSLTDVTGDGRADLVFQKNNKLWVARNTPGAGGTSLLGAGVGTAQLADTTFASGAFEVRSSTRGRFASGATEFNDDKVWRMAIDMNGDGRMDIVDAAEAAGKWVVYVNTPSSGDSGVTWARREFAIGQLYNHLLSRGHRLSGNHLPLASRYTGRDQTFGACWRYDGTQWVDHPEGFNLNGSPCNPAQYPPVLLGTGPEKTFTEWELKDVNGDGFPDLVFNSSRVDSVAVVPEIWDNYSLFLNGPRLFRLGLLAGNLNKVEAALNLRGLMVSTGTNPFSTPINLKVSSCGVGLWTSFSIDEQYANCALADINGDSVLDRVEGGAAWLGTGRGFTSVKLSLPGNYAAQQSFQEQTCLVPQPRPPGSTEVYTSQRTGLRDLTGDGIPDYVERDRTHYTWTVSVGTGAGFAPPIPVEVVGSQFSFTGGQERCDGLASTTSGGLYDLDGDGKPELVFGGSSLGVYQLTGGSLPGRPEAGRIIQVDNGYGAKTSVGYRSAKEDGTTKHQVPFPEIVVTSVRTTGAQGLGGSLAATWYAYGGAELLYDSALQTFTMPGYQRSVELRIVSIKDGKVEGRATLTDTYPLPAFVASPKEDRFGRYLLAGKVRDVTVLSGTMPTDPWALLTVDLGIDPRRVGATHYDWATKLFEEPDIPGTLTLDCLEMAYPLDFQTSLFAGGTPYDACSSHGFAYARVTDAWRGSGAPPSFVSNVGTRSEITQIDDYGRVLSVLHEKDKYRPEDDVCIETRYATPTGANERVLHAVKSRTVRSCNKATPLALASDTWLYDGLSAGSVSNGFVTSHNVNRYNVTTGTVLETLREYDAQYDANGNPSTLTQTRNEDGAERITRLTFDPFGIALVGKQVQATGTPSFSASATLDPFSLAQRSTTDSNATVFGTDFDGYGRPVRSTVQPPGGALGVLATVDYLGFSGTDPLGRRVVAKSFPDAVAPGTEGSAPGRTAIVALDELGRERRTEVALGADYANAVLVTGARTYDDQGRVAFQADPYPLGQNGATAYGTTYLFNTDGTPSCHIRGHGPQTLSQVTDEATERYPTCFSRTFGNRQETWSVSEPDSLLAGSPQAGVTTTATLSAVGRLLSRSTLKAGARLEHAVFSHDGLGQLTRMTRYLDPVALTGPVTWTWTMDSFGQALQWQEPETAPRTASFSNWGELTEVAWIDTTTLPSTSYRITQAYDGLGRATHREELRNGVADPEMTTDFVYDVGSSPTSLVTPQYVQGRVARLKSATGSVYFSYDAFGRQNARTFTDREGTPYVERSAFHDNGTPRTLELLLPDTGYQREQAVYTFDSADRLRKLTYSDATTNPTLYEALDIDVLGRVRQARYGAAIDRAAAYADVGRRLLQEVDVSSAAGSRHYVYQGYDPLGREKQRLETSNGSSSGLVTKTAYDALGRVASSVGTKGIKTLEHWQFTYDPLGNVLTLKDVLRANDAALSYGTADRDRLCRIGYGDGGLGGTACNVTHDGSGNVVTQATRTGTRQLTYFPSGQVFKVNALEGSATFHYGALGAIRELELTGAEGSDARHSSTFGGLIERRDQTVNGTSVSFLSRNIPGPEGFVASRRGPGDTWVYGFGEQRGSRLFMGGGGGIVQEQGYHPFGEMDSTGEAPSSPTYTTTGWNGGEALAVLGLSHLGARLYDPVIGRFLSRDPLRVPRTAATTNPYAFAMNDPVNLSDPTGLDPAGCMGQECDGPPGGGGFPGGGGGPRDINPIDIYLPSPTPQASAPQVPAYRPPPASLFLPPGGPQTIEGFVLKATVKALTGIALNDSFNYDSLAATGISATAAVDAILNTQQGAEAVVAEYNATLDRWSSYAQGFGDSVIFWCPGCTQNMRDSWGITSGGDGYYYAVGSVTGIVGSIAAPAPSSIIAPPKADVAAEFRQFVRINELDKVNPTLCRSNCAAVAAAVDSTLAGTPKTAPAGPRVSPEVLEQQFGTTFQQVSSRSAIERTVTGWGPGSRGIVGGKFVGKAEGHVFNVIHFQNQASFFDGQSPWVSQVNWQIYDSLWLMRTN